MAKQKLSPRQRTHLRKQIQAKLRTGVARSEILKTFSAKYKISPESVRWYMKNGVANKAKPEKNSTQRHLNTLKRSITEGSTAVLEIAKRVSLKGLERAVKVKKLLPQLAEDLKKKADLVQMERNVKKAVRAVSAHARKVQRLIARVLGS